MGADLGYLTCPGIEHDISPCQLSLNELVMPLKKEKMPGMQGQL